VIYRNCTIPAIPDTGTKFYVGTLTKMPLVPQYLSLSCREKGCKERTKIGVLYYFLWGGFLGV
jgi:hypothetical protein